MIYERVPNACVTINDSDGDGRPDILVAKGSVAEQPFRNMGLLKLTCQPE
jgi:hypothetical protein